MMPWNPIDKAPTGLARAISQRCFGQHFSKTSGGAAPPPCSYCGGRLALPRLGVPEEPCPLHGLPYDDLSALLRMRGVGCPICYAEAHPEARFRTEIVARGTASLWSAADLKEPEAVGEVRIEPFILVPAKPVPATLSSSDPGECRLRTRAVHVLEVGLALRMTAFESGGASGLAYCWAPIVGWRIP